MKIQAYIYHKRAEKYSDCQDYFNIDLQNNRIAVADGMTQSIYPQWWAKILVNAYLENGKIPSSSEELKTYQDIWQKQVQNEIDKREKAGKNPWRLKNTFAERSGAGSTLCGFSWKDNDWEGQCIGDSSIIEVYKDYSIKIHSSQEGDFGNHPDYLDSFGDGRGSFKPFQGSFNDVISILLVTDPFSELFQKNIENKEFITARLKEISALSDHTSYGELIENWRDDFEMHNDDSTLIILGDFCDSTHNTEHIYKLEDLCIKEDQIYSIEEETLSIEKVNEHIPSMKYVESFVSSEDKLKATEEALCKAEAKVKALEKERDVALAKVRAAERARDHALAKANARKPYGVKGLIKSKLLRLKK